MPEKVLPKEKEIYKLFFKLEEMKFDRIGSSSYIKNKERLDWEPPRDQEGVEVSFSHYNNGLEVVVHTSILKENDTPAENDGAWVLIRDKDNVLFYSPRLHRTKNFVLTLLIWTEIAQALIKHRPLCPECKAFMDLRKSREYRSYHWLCTKTERHEKSLVHKYELITPVFQELNIKTQRYWNMYKSKYNWYLRKLHKESLQPGKASKRRRKWKIGRPENLELPSTKK